MHVIEKYLHENLLILVTQIKVNNLLICISIANVHFSVFLLILVYFYFPLMS